MYGVPHGRGANLLMWRTDKVTPAPDSWSVVWDENSPYKGKVTAYDSPIYIADAALYLKATQPDLKIDNVYELDDTQFQAASRPAEEAARDHRRVLVGLHQGAGRVRRRQLGRRHDVAGDREPAASRTRLPIETTLPKEGSTGWSDTWMISSKAKHPNCMYMWMNHIISPKANAAVAEWFGEAPSNEKSCALTADKDHCTTYHADDEDYFTKVAYWTTPVKDCGDDRGEVCKDYSEWVQAWTEIKG